MELVWHFFAVSLSVPVILYAFYSYIVVQLFNSLNFVCSLSTSFNVTMADKRITPFKQNRL